MNDLGGDTCIQFCVLPHICSFLPHAGSVFVDAVTSRCPQGLITEKLLGRKHGGRPTALRGCTVNRTGRTKLVSTV